MLCYFLSGRLKQFQFYQEAELTVRLQALIGPGRHKGKFTVENFSSEIFICCTNKKQIELIAKIVNYQA